MNHRRPLLAALVTSVLLLGLALVSPRPSAAAKRYLCPPCGQSCDTTTFDAPGVCPRCGMTLIEQGSAAPEPAPRHTVAVLIFPNVEIIDYTAPWELFGDAGYRVFTVAATRDPVKTAMGMTVVPDHTFDDAPAADILLVPGGGVEDARGDARTLRFVRERSAGSGHTMSVCNGAFILASAGLLDGLGATTTAGLIDKLRADFPRVKVVDDQRFVDNGRIITTAGLSAGMDGALHLIAVLEGPGFAKKVALDEEYDWRPNSGFVRAALADRNIPAIDIDGIGEWKASVNDGDREHWEVVAEGTSTLDADQIMQHVGAALEKARWTRRTHTDTPAEHTSGWTFFGRDGHTWSSVLTLRPVSGASGRYTIRLTLARAG